MAYNNTTIEKQEQTIIGMINVSNYTMTATFRFSIEEQESYYSHQTQLYIDYITDACRKLEAWELGEIYFTNTPPDYHEMIDKELDLLKRINDYTPRYNLPRIVHNGMFDKAMAGVFLKTLDPYSDKQQTATIALERIRWLTEHMKSTKEEHIAPPHEPEDNLDSKELAFLCDMTKKLKLTTPLKKCIDYGSKLKFTTNQVLFALYQYCEEENFICAKSVQCFSEKLQPLIAPKLTPNSIQQRIGRANNETGETFIGDSRLKNLTWRSLMDKMGWKEQRAKNKFKKWEGLYELVKKAAQNLI